MTVFLDTNVLAYAFDDGAGAKQQRARELLVEHAAEAVVSTQVLIELHAVLTRRLGRSREEAERVLAAIDLDVAPTDQTLVMAAARTAVAHQVAIFDALILEAAAVAGCERLLTEDLSAGSVLRGVRIENPFS